MTTFSVINCHAFPFYSIDGCCRHVAATLFEVQDFQDDRLKSSVTSGKCSWVKRSTAITEAVDATALQTSILKRNSTEDHPATAAYNPIPDSTPLPNPDTFFDMVKQTTPEACMLDTWEIRPEPTMDIPELPVLTPSNKIDIFLQCHGCTDDNICNEDCIEELYEYLGYSEEEKAQIDKATRGQHLNQNWHFMRKKLVTASNFKKVCNSTNRTKTAIALLNGNNFNNAVPGHIEFGRKYEDKARIEFLKAHRYKHKKCSIDTPGFIVNSNFPFLGASPDGVLECVKCGPKALIEIKCLSSNKNYQPSNALVLSKICLKKSDGSLYVDKKHPYFFQIQGQMAICQISQCWLVAYTHKGICPVLVEFDPDFWQDMLDKLDLFYREVFFYILKGGFAP